jgi:hypothetical protein
MAERHCPPPHSAIAGSLPPPDKFVWLMDDDRPGLWAAVSNAGEVYLPGLLTGHPSGPLFAATVEGVPFIEAGGCYFPCTWLAVAFPEWAASLVGLADDLRQIARGEMGGDS